MNAKGEKGYKTRTMIDRLLELQITRLAEILWGGFTADRNIVEAYCTIVIADDKAGFYAALRGPRQAQ